MQDEENSHGLDSRNKKIISQIASLPFVRPSTTLECERLLQVGTPEDRSSFVKKRRKLTMYVMTAFAIFILIPFPHSPKPSNPPPLFNNAGQVIRLELHDTVLSTSTTVLTSVGTYQVSGAVSASNGDSTRLKSVRFSDGSPAESFLCVDSAIKSSCYRIM